MNSKACSFEEELPAAALIRLVSAFGVLLVICRENTEAFTPETFQGCLSSSVKAAGARGSQLTSIESTPGLNVQLSSRQQETHPVASQPGAGTQWERPLALGGPPALP